MKILTNEIECSVVTGNAGLEKTITFSDCSVTAVRSFQVAVSALIGKVRCGGWLRFFYNFKSFISIKIRYRL